MMRPLCIINTTRKSTKKLQSVSTFALCFRVMDIGVGVGGGLVGVGGGLMGELVNLQMDQFSDICQGFNK